MLLFLANGSTLFFWRVVAIRSHRFYLSPSSDPTKDKHFAVFIILINKSDKFELKLIEIFFVQLTGESGLGMNTCIRLLNICPGLAPGMPVCIVPLNG